MQQEAASGVALLPRSSPCHGEDAAASPAPALNLSSPFSACAARHGFPPVTNGFFGGDAVSGVGGGPLRVRLRPSRHSFLPLCFIAGANSVFEALEGLCNGAVGVKRQIVIHRSGLSTAEKIQILF